MEKYTARASFLVNTSQPSRMYVLEMIVSRVVGGEGSDSGQKVGTRIMQDPTRSN